jgi:hypothetical protein
MPRASQTELFSATNSASPGSKPMRRAAFVSNSKLALLMVLVFCLYGRVAGANNKTTQPHNSEDFDFWSDGLPSRAPSFATPSSPDNWLGGSGNWSNGADWSAGEPGSSSDVFINTGNDYVTLDTNANINSLTLGGSSGSSTLIDPDNFDTYAINIAGALTINSTGTLTLSGADAIIANANSVNAGTINLNGIAGVSVNGNFTNSGSINIGGAGGVSASGTLTNSGSIANSMEGGVSAANLVNSGGVFVTVISAGTVTNQASGIIAAQNLTVTNMMNAGQVGGLLGTDNNLTITGTLTNTGGFSTLYGGGSVGTLVNSGNVGVGILSVQGNATNSGGIDVIYNGPSNDGQRFTVGGTLTNTQTGQIEIQGGFVSGSANALINGGTIQLLSIENVGGGTFSAGAVTNTGMIETGGNGTDNVVSFATLNSQQGGILSLGGTGDVATIGVVTNAGTISIANGATLTVPVSSHATGNALSGFLNSGIVQIATGGTLSSLNKYTQTAGQTTIDGTLQGQSNFAGGAIYGNGGTLQGNVSSNAAFNLGDMPMTIGTMAITGGYTQGANGSLYVDIASLTSYDQLNISGHASLNGLLSVDLLNGYIPQVGNMFDVVNFAGSSGTFSMVLGLPINNNEHFVLEYNSSNLTLDVVSGADLQATSGKWTGSGDVYYEPYVTDGSQAANLAYDLGSAPSGTVPEPGSLMLLASGIAGITALRQKKTL